MKKINFTLATMFHSRGDTSGVGPKTVWKLIIGTTILTIIFSAVASIFFYKWVSISEGPMAPLKPEKDAMSTAEIRALVDYYKAKQTHYKELLQTRPVAPVLEKGSGVEIDVSAMSALGDTLNVETDVVVPVSSTP